MVSLDEAGRLAMALPQVAEGTRHGHRTWLVAGKVFAWERPFSKADLRRFGDAAPPDGPILAVSVDDLSEKEAALAAHPTAFFTIPHFDGYAAVLVLLDEVELDELEELITESWITRAPKRVLAAYLASQS